MSTSLHRKVSAILTRQQSATTEQQQERLRAIQGLNALQERQTQQKEYEATNQTDSNTAAGGATTSLSLHRSFRTLLQSRNLDLYRSLLNEFGPVAGEIKTLEASLDESALLAQQLADQLKEMKTRSNHLFQSTANLNQQQTTIEAKRALVTSFLTQFQLSPHDLKILNETTEDGINDEFFQVLEKITDMKRKIEMMMSGAQQQQPNNLPQMSPSVSGNTLTGSNRISLDLLDSLSKQLEVSYEKLYRFIQSQLSGQHIIKTSDLHSKFIISFQRLRNIPVYFDHCLNDFISQRRSLLIERFLKALSRGTASTRPIELSAHDPVRYCSDMLAWIHQALANEKEFLMTLFPPNQSTPDLDPKLSLDSSPSTTPESQNYQLYLSSIFEALSRPLRVRIEQSFSHVGSSGGSVTSSTSPSATVSHAQIETVFKIWNILKFYRVIIEPILPQQTINQSISASLKSPDALLASLDHSVGSPSSTNTSSDLLSTLSLLGDQARTSFFHFLDAAGERLSRSQSLPPDLAPAPPLAEWITQLAAIMNIYNSALIAPNEKEAEFEEIMTKMMEPLLISIGINQTTASSTIPTALDVDHLIYRVNVLHAVLTVCQQFPSFVSRRIETLTFLVNQQLELLVEQQTKQVWKKANMDGMIQLISTSPVGTNFSHSPAMSLTNLTSGINTFYSSLLSVGAFIVPQCDRLMQTPARRHTRQAIAQLISKQYKQLYAAVTSPTSGFDPAAIQTIFIHAPSHVDLLLDLNSATTPTVKA